jgi:hypothetical protein
VSQTAELVLPADAGQHPQITEALAREALSPGELDVQAFDGIVAKLEGLGDTAPEVVAAAEAQSFIKPTGAGDANLKKHP